MPLPERLIQPVSVSRGTLQVAVPDELEGVTNGTLANIIRQLSTLSRHAEEMFGNLFSEAEAVAHKSSALQARIDKISMKVTQLDSTVEEVSLQDIHLRKAFRSNQAFDQQVVSRETMPKAMLEVYLACDQPPPLEKLNPYRDDGKDGLKFYTDPNYFFDLWRQEMLKDTERMMHDRGKKPGGTSSGGGKKHRPRQAGNSTERHRQKALGQGEYLVEQQQQQQQQQQQREYMQNQQLMYDQMLQQQQQMNPQMQPHMSQQMFATAQQEPIYTPRILRNEQEQQSSPQRMQMPSLQLQQQFDPQQALIDAYGSSATTAQSPTRRPNQPPPAPPPGDLMGLNSPPPMMSPTNTNQRDSLPPPPPPPNGIAVSTPAMQLPTTDSSELLPPPPPVPVVTNSSSLGVQNKMDHMAPSPPPPPEPIVNLVNGGGGGVPSTNGVKVPVSNTSSPVKSASAPAPPPPPPPPPGGLLTNNGSSSVPPKSGNSILSPPELKKPSKPTHLQTGDGVRSDLLKAIRDGIALRKVEQQAAAKDSSTEDNKASSSSSSTGQTDVASILARRVAVEMSDSDDGGAHSDSEYDSDDWGDESTA